MPHFKAFGVMNLQYETRICHKIYDKSTTSKCQHKLMSDLKKLDKLKYCITTVVCPDFFETDVSKSGSWDLGRKGGIVKSFFGMLLAVI